MSEHTLLLAQIEAANHAAAVSRNRLDDLLLQAEALELEIEEAIYQGAEIKREQGRLHKRKSRLLTGKN